jgi:hypothetical protein
MARTINVYYASSSIALALAFTNIKVWYKVKIHCAAKGVIYDRNTFIVQAAGVYVIKLGKTDLRERFSTVDLLTKVPCFAKKMNRFSIEKAAGLNQLVKGGQMY